jgi:hypothetical protein
VAALYEADREPLGCLQSGKLLDRRNSYGEFKENCITMSATFAARELQALLLLSYSEPTPSVKSLTTETLATNKNPGLPE